MAARIFLGLSALVWIPYGIACALDPAMLAESAGVVASTPTGTTELRAMYGGLQIAIGLIALAGAVRLDLSRAALVALGLLCAGLGLARLAGVLADAEVTFYTGAALAFELGSAAVAAALARRSPVVPEPARA